MVTMSPRQSLQKQCIASGNVGTTNSCSTSHQEILDEESVDVSGVASKITQEYRIQYYRRKLGWNLIKPSLPGAKLAGSFASQ